MLIAATNNAFASDSIADGEVVVTLRNSQPCFSYPLDEATKKNKFFLHKIEVSFNKGLAAYPSTKSWELKINQANRPLFTNPNTPEQCIEYGTATPTQTPSPVIPIEINIPHRVFLTIYSPEIASSSASIRSYYNDFCLSLGTSNNKILIRPVFNPSTGVFKCGK